MVASLILGFIQGNSSGVLSVFMLIMFLANVVILAMVGWSALRSKDGGAAEGGDESESAAAEGEEGEEAQETDEGIEAEE
jgi:type III secretory pathway component EscV